VGCPKADETTRGVAIVGWPINISDQTRGVEYSQNILFDTSGLIRGTRQQNNSGRPLSRNWLNIQRKQLMAIITSSGLAECQQNNS